MIFGDYHNFGRRVEVLNEIVLKPRSLWGEWYFLSKRSPLVKLLRDNKFVMDQLVGLNFYGEIDGLPTLSMNQVSRVILDAEPEKPIFDYFKIGEVIGFCTFFGIGDLHVDNVRLGQVDKKFIFSPIDIECFFENYFLPSQTLLIPSHVLDKEHCGMKEVIEKIVGGSKKYSVLDLVEGYCNTLDRLYNLKTIVYDLILKLDLENISSRVILRSTHKYDDTNQDFLPEEKVQLERGDIPYFFKFLSKKQIYYWESELNYGELKSEIKDIKLETQLKSFSEDFFSEDKMNKQYFYGSAQIVKVFESIFDYGDECISEFASLKKDKSGKFILNLKSKKIIC